MAQERPANELKRVYTRYLLPGRSREQPHLSTGQYAHRASSGGARRSGQQLGVRDHSLRRTKPAQIYTKTGNLTAVQLLLGRYLGIEVDDALSISEQVEL